MGPFFISRCFPPDKEAYKCPMACYGMIPRTPISPPPPLSAPFVLGPFNIMEEEEAGKQFFIRCKVSRPKEGLF